MEESVFNQEKIDLIESAGEVKALDDMYIIEDVAMGIKGLLRKIDFYQNYKKKKVSDIDKEVGGLKKRIEFLKKVILATLEQNKEKSLSFPGSCKIVTRKVKGKWIVKDEESFINSLKDENEFDQVVEELIEHKIIKKEANKLLNAWEESGKIENVSDFVEKGQEKTSISITYLTNVESKKTEEKNLASVSEKDNDYDSLNF